MSIPNEGLNPPEDEFETHPIFERDEMISHVYEALDDRSGRMVSASALYSAAYGIPYDSSNPAAQKARLYIQLALNPRHGFGKHFYAKSVAEGRFVQTGTMYVFKSSMGDDRDIFQAYMQVPNLNTVLSNSRPRRVYRMHAPGEYRPPLHVGKEMLDTGMVEWERAIGPEVDYVPVEQTAKKVKQAESRRAVRVAKLRQACDSTPVREEAKSKRPEWESSFVLAVRDAIALKTEEGLMIEGEIPAKNIKWLTVSNIIGTQTNRDRLYRAGLLARGKTKIDASLTAVELIFAELIKAKKEILGQKTPAQKLAIRIVEQEVEAYFDSLS